MNLNDIPYPIFMLIAFLTAFVLAYAFMMISNPRRKPLLDCDWHRGEDPLASFEQARCCRCDKYMKTNYCGSCGSIFLDFTGYSPWTHQPTIFNGELMCSECAEHAIDVEA